MVGDQVGMAIVLMPQIGRSHRSSLASAQPGVLTYDAQYLFVVDPGSCSRQHADDMPIAIAGKRQNDLLHRLANFGFLFITSGLLVIMLVVSALIDIQPLANLSHR